VCAGRSEATATTLFKTSTTAVISSISLQGKNLQLIASLLTVGLPNAITYTPLLVASLLVSLLATVFDLLSSKHLIERYPLFSRIYQICYEEAQIDSIIDGLYIPNKKSAADPQDSVIEEIEESPSKEA